MGKEYCRMGNLNLEDLMESNNKGNIRGLTITKLPEEFNYEVCVLNKLTCMFSSPLIRMCN